MSIQVYGIFDSKMSLGYVSCGVAEGLVALNVDCRLTNILRDDAVWDQVLQREPCSNEFGVADLHLAPFAGRNVNATIGIYIGPFPIPMRLLSCHQIKIAFLVCEQHSLASSLVEQCNQFQLICVPSTFCRNVFLEAGVKVPIRKVVHGLFDAFSPAKPRAESHQFQFFNSFASFAPPERKGFGELVDCFCDVFPGDPSTELVIRTQPTAVACERIFAASSKANVKLEPLTYDPLECYVARFSMVDCLVHPSKAEGFGLTPFHALACGVPVIAPAHTGFLEYLDTENSALIHWTSTKDLPYCISLDRESLRAQLQAVRTCASIWKQRAHDNARSLRERFAWPNVLRSFLNSIQEILNGSSVFQSLSKWEEE